MTAYINNLTDFIMIETAFISNPISLQHDMGPDHPESPMRVAAIMRHFSNIGLDKKLKQIQSTPAYDDSLLRVHHPHHIDQLEKLSLTRGLIQLDEDTLMGPHSYQAALMSAGAGIQAVAGIMSGQYQRAFCAGRPPGHHAEPKATKGFCFYNNIAIAAQELRFQYGIKKIAIIDFDAHQGNGTVEIFKNIKDVLFCSSFQHPFYPHSHWNIDRPNIINSPLTAFSDGDALRKVWHEQWEPALIAHEPEFIFVSAGFDAHRDDPMAELNWLVKDYQWITERICSIANRYADGRIISMLEGGYDLRALAACTEAHIDRLLSY